MGAFGGSSAEELSNYFSRDTRQQEQTTAAPPAAKAEDGSDFDFNRAVAAEYQAEQSQSTSSVAPAAVPAKDTDPVSLMRKLFPDRKEGIFIQKPQKQNHLISV